MLNSSRESSPGSGRQFGLVAGFVVALALLVASCSGSSDSSGARSSDPAAAVAAALDDSRKTTTTTTVVATTTTVQTEPLDPTEIPGAIVNQFTLGLGDCFDQLRDLQNGLPVVITTKLGCNTPHEFEVFHRLTFPAGFPAIFPGEKVMTDFALQSCYQKFEGWVGKQYEVSELDIEVLTPTQTNFENSVARYRGIHCFIHRTDGEPLVRTTRSSAL